MIYDLQIPKNCGYQLCRIQGESSKQCREWPVHLIACTTRLLQKKEKRKKKTTSRVLGRQNVENMAWAKGKINFIS